MLLFCILHFGTLKIRKTPRKHNHEALSSSSSQSLSLASCAPSTKSAVHEKRAPGISGWSPRDIKLDRRTVLPLSIAFTQENLDKGYDFLMKVSDPNSPSYASHWTPKKA